MDKGKKKKEEFVKLDMSFEDAMRLAMKTPPLMTMDLILNEEQELRDHETPIAYSGRIIQFRQMFVQPDTERVHNFYIEIKRTANDIRRLIPAYRPSTNSYAAVFTESDTDQDPWFQINDNEKVFLTLRVLNKDIETKVAYCRVAFSLPVRSNS